MKDIISQWNKQFLGFIIMFTNKKNKMKQTIFLWLCVAICQHSFCQTDTIKIKTKTSPVSGIKKTVTLQPQTGKNIPVPKLPDLRITSLNVKQISTPSGAKYLEISYTVKNDGTAAVDLSKISMDGRIKISTTSLRDDAGCGSDISTISGTLLNPGEAHSDSYRCSIVLDFSVYKYYVLSVSTKDAVKELDVTNNSATTTILIQ